MTQPRKEKWIIELSIEYYVFQTSQAKRDGLARLPCQLVVEQGLLVPFINTTVTVFFV